MVGGKAPLWERGAANTEQPRFEAIPDDRNSRGCPPIAVDAARAPRGRFGGTRAPLHKLAPAILGFSRPLWTLARRPIPPRFPHQPALPECKGASLAVRCFCSTKTTSRKETP
jgi:hypothetical protein